MLSSFHFSSLSSLSSYHHRREWNIVSSLLRRYIFLFNSKCEEIIHQNLNDLPSNTNGEILYHDVQVNVDHGCQERFSVKCKFESVSQTKVLYGFRRLGIWCIGHTDYFNDAFMVPF